MNTTLPTSLHYQGLIERVTLWAQLRPDIQAALILGSRARSDRPADAWSDLDLAIITTEPEGYLAQSDWLADLGTVWITFVEPTATGQGLERRALFAPGVDVDFAIVSAMGMAQIMQSAEVLAVLRRGMRVLIDKQGIIPQEQLAALPPVASPAPPSPAEFQETISDFWYHCIWTAKKLRRGELWTAIDCCNGYLKRLLLRVIEWHAQATHPAGYDTWHKGRFLEEWADPRVVTELAATFAHYDAADTWRSLLATMRLFRWVTQEAATRLSYPYPRLADVHASELVIILQNE